ncbi:MAG: hypothetical protein SGJ02_13350 [bacterium]|nr:hypothetical protein [bacterium]
MKINWCLPFITVLAFLNIASAGEIRGKINGSGNADFKSGGQVIALAPDGTTLDIATVDSDGKFTLTYSGNGAATLQFIDKTNQYRGPAISRCIAATKNIINCPYTSTNLGLGFSGKRGTILMKFKVKDGFILFKVYNLNQKKQTKVTIRARGESGEPICNGDLGFNSGTVTDANITNITDADKDGCPEAFDIDNDGDGILNSYDDTDNNPASSSVSAATGTSISPLFTNLKLNIENSLNANTGTTPTTNEIDLALSTQGTLAISVMGDTADTTELNCGGLNYCSNGGTGQNSSQSFPESFDSDADGFGTITKGGTGDFQLNHGATSSEIRAGDTMVEVVTETDTTVTEVPGMLNFVFNTTPAVKSVTVSSTVNTIVYPAAANMLGSSTNCIQVPATGDVSVTIEAWRAQRPGITEAGEAAFVDIGKSLIVIDIPNGPPGAIGNGPGNCNVSTYSESDSNLSIGTNGLEDAFVDTDADPINTFTFTVNVSDCLGSQDADWGSGESVFIDLQSRSNDGDNAAQKFCLERL